MIGVVLGKRGGGCEINHVPPLWVHGDGDRVGCIYGQIYQELDKGERYEQQSPVFLSFPGEGLFCADS